MTRIVLLAALLGALGAAPAAPKEDKLVRNYGFKVEFRPGAGDPADGLKALPDDDCVVTVTDKEQKATTFNLIDCLPTNYSELDFGTGAEVSLGEIHVKVNRIELA